LEALIGRGAIDEASRFAWRVLARDPGAGSVLVTTLVRSGHGGIAREIQQVWIDVDSDFSRSDWQELSTAAEISGDLRGLHQSLALHGLSSLRKGELAGKAFLQILRYRGAAALVPWQGLLTEDILAEEPLVAAAWASWRRRPQETYDPGTGQSGFRSPKICGVRPTTRPCSRARPAMHAFGTKSAPH
jgi:hypothetical protein